MCARVKDELKGLSLNNSNIELFTTHDGAANMQKASCLPKSTQFQHCSAHSLHLLLMTDSINTLMDLVDLLDRCKSTAQRLDSKCNLITDARLKLSTSKMIESIQEQLSCMQEILEADECIIPSLPDDNGDDNAAVQQIAVAVSTDCGQHQHTYVKTELYHSLEFSLVHDDSILSF